MSAIDNFPKYLFLEYNKFRKEVPSMTKAHQFIDNLIYFIFPFKIDKKCTLPLIELNLAQLQLDFKDLLDPIGSLLDQSINQLSKDFFEAIPAIYDSLIKDAQLFVDFDPAARSRESVILYYPGFYAISVYRLSHRLFELKIPYVPRMICEYAHSKTGIDIHPGALIGEHFFIDHGTGIVIGETTIIGNNVKIYQGVTLGAASVDKKLKGKKRHPTLEDNVIVYSGSTILGGDTIIGHDTVVGGNVWLTKSVPPFSLVYHESKVVIRDNKNFVAPDNFVI
ncbi:MAG TPA: serine acetyltransferase [Bacteroidales bacterium]|jgi:serine O-acetyltransferase|nr:serine acetyltransferase [Bacteroidales bacterium]